MQKHHNWEWTELDWIRTELLLSTGCLSTTVSLEMALLFRKRLKANSSTNLCECQLFHSAGGESLVWTREKWQRISGIPSQQRWPSLVSHRAALLLSPAEDHWLWFQHHDGALNLLAAKWCLERCLVLPCRTQMRAFSVLLAERGIKRKNLSSQE